jgi:hypothetical protein
VTGWLIAFVVAAAAGGCDPCACVNTCTRSYGLHAYETPAEGERIEPVRFRNPTEGGMDCEMDEKPLSLREGSSVVQGAIRSVGPASAGVDGSPRFQYDVDLAGVGRPDEASTICEGASRTFSSVGELDREEVAVGESICVSGNVRATTWCTQKGCGY